MFVVRKVDRVILDESRTDNLALVEESDQTGEFLLIQASLDEEDEQDADLGSTVHASCARMVRWRITPSRRIA